MGDTFNSFVRFISDDPIMLGLCVAIIVLVIAFILVLILGRKKDNKNLQNMENTSELLKTEVNLEALKSTQEFNAAALKNESDRESQEEEEPTIVEEENPTDNEGSALEIEESSTIEEEKSEETPAVEEVVEEPMEVQESSIEEKEEVPTETVDLSLGSEENPLDTLQIQEEVIKEDSSSVEGTSNEVESSIEAETEEKVEVAEEKNMPSFDDIRIETPVEDIPVLDTLEETTAPTEETPAFSFEPVFNEPIVEEEPIKEEPLDESTVLPIVESQVNPLEEDPKAKEEPLSVFPIMEEKQEEFPTISTPFPTMEEMPAFNKENVETQKSEELPDLVDEKFSRTALIRHIPVMENDQNAREATSINSDEAMEDLDLPKLNTNSASSNEFLNSLKGETFDIK